MSQRSAGACTRCTRANAFPAFLPNYYHFKYLSSWIAPIPEGQEKWPPEVAIYASYCKLVSRNKWFIPKVQHFEGKIELKIYAHLDFETSYLKTLQHWSFHFLVRHWQNDSCYPIRNLVAYQKRSIFCCFSKCLSAIGWTDFCSKHSVEFITAHDEKIGELIYPHIHLQSSFDISPIFQWLSIGFDFLHIVFFQ
jgi:hypothetical protein